ncbi:MAG: SLC13 family permease, partial [Halanaerobiaceae bacterium]
YPAKAGLSDLSLNKDVVLVSLLVLFYIFLFLWEPVRTDIIALTIPIVLVILKKWTNISTDEAISGFANQATITVMAMFMLGKGVENSGLVHTLGDKIIELAGKEEKKQLGIISILSGAIAGFLNNTPVVAIFIPMVRKLARDTGTSPSKLLMPLSYAAMLGGMTTLIGTSTNILASDLSDRIIGRPFSMFEFTILGIIVLLIGCLYLIFFSTKLIPERIKANEGYFREFQLEEFITEVLVCENSPFIDKRLSQCDYLQKFDIDVLNIIRDGVKYEAEKDSLLKEGDRLLLRADQENLLKLLEINSIELLPEVKSEGYLNGLESGKVLAEVVISHDSSINGKSLGDLNFFNDFNAILLAIRRGGKLSHSKMENIKLKPGDVLLIYAREDDIRKMQRNTSLIFAKEIEDRNLLDYKKNYSALIILIFVIALAALQLLPIVITAFLGVIAMIFLGHLKADEIYTAVNWQVIFLLAGVIPLGIAMEKSGTSNFIARIILELSKNTAPIFTLGIFYFATCLLTNIISNNASVVLMIPVGIEVASNLRLSPFSFVLAITFAASTAFLTPMGYQTNMMIYGPGGYKFRDFFKVGFPLQIILAIVTVLGIYLIWGI